MTVRELLARVDSAELSEWVAFLQIEREGDAPAAPDDVEESIRGFFRRKHEG